MEIMEKKMETTIWGLGIGTHPSLTTFSNSTTEAWKYCGILPRNMRRWAVLRDFIPVFSDMKTASLMFYTPTAGTPMTGKQKSHENPFVSFCMGNQDAARGSFTGPS